MSPSLITPAGAVSFVLVLGVSWPTFMVMQDPIVMPSLSDLVVLQWASTTANLESAFVSNNFMAACHAWDLAALQEVGPLHVCKVAVVMMHPSVAPKLQYNGSDDHITSSIASSGTLHCHCLLVIASKVTQHCTASLPPLMMYSIARCLLVTFPSSISCSIVVALPLHPCNATSNNASSI